MTAKELKIRLDNMQRAKEEFLRALVELYGPKLALQVLHRAGVIGQNITK